MMDKTNSKKSSLAISLALCFSAVFVAVALAGCIVSEHFDREMNEAFLEAIEEYDRLFREETILQSTIQHIAYNLATGERDIDGELLSEIETKILDLLESLSPDGSLALTKLRGVHTSFIYPSLSRKQRKFRHVDGVSSICIADNYAPKFFHPSILWIDTMGVAPEEDNISSVTTLVFETAPEGKKQTVLIVFQLRWDREQNAELVSLSYKKW